MRKGSFMCPADSACRRGPLPSRDFHRDGNFTCPAENVCVNSVDQQSHGLNRGTAGQPNPSDKTQKFTTFTTSSENQITGDTTPETLNAVVRESIGVNLSEQNEPSISSILNLIQEDIGTNYRTMVGNHEIS